MFILLCLLVLGYIIYQDFQYRAISWWTIPLVFLSNLSLAIGSFYFDWKMIVINLILVAFQYLGVTIYFSIKNREVINITQQYLGLGDILFLLAITPLFAPLHFCCFLIISLFLTLIIAALLFILNRTLKTIPLAGFLSLYLLLLIPLVKILQYSLYYDFTLLQFLYG
jgi:hypothetical protein